MFAIPKSILQNVVMMVEGNMYEASQFLLSRGWSISGGDLASLRDSNNEFFSVPYYFGVWKREYKKRLLSGEPGTFLTTIDSANVSGGCVLYYVDSDKNLKSLPLGFPTVSNNLIKNLGLLRPLQRPASVTFQELTPFLL
jgi:hypothetical protein